MKLRGKLLCFLTSLVLRSFVSISSVEAKTLGVKLLALLSVLGLSMTSHEDAALLALQWTQLHAQIQTGSNRLQYCRDAPTDVESDVCVHAWAVPPVLNSLMPSAQSPRI